MMISSAQTEADVTSKVTLEVGDNMLDVACGEAPSDCARDKITQKESWDG
jgi:ubiquinone/menaquinone biosynthesis C-methylase UbiE